MDISIIIVNYNTKDITVNCIDSILKARPKLDYEIIIVDNGSTDGSLALFEKIRGPKVRIVSHKKNVGFAKGNNSGLRRAVGQYLLLLNSDTLVTRGSIEVLYEFAKKTPNLGIVGPKLLNEDGSPQPSVFNLPSVIRTIKQYWLNRGNILDKYVPRNSKPVEVEAIVAAAVLLTPLAIKKVGTLDERYFMYFEDLEYCRQIKKAGLKVFYHPGSEIYHLHGASGKGIAENREQWKRLIPSSKIYHGVISHYLIWFIMWTGQKLNKLF